MRWLTNIMNRTPSKTRAVVIVVSLLIIAGCVRVPVGNPESHEIEFDGEIAVRDESFRMNGTVYVELGPKPGPVYQDVYLRLYDDERRELDSIRIGTLSAGESGPTSQRVNITTRTTPTYVVVESTTFWNERASGLRVVSFERTAEGYDRYYRVNESRFPRSLS